MFRLKKNFSIFVGNGLGNQLFVYSYILNLFEKNGKNHTRISILLTRKPRAWAPYSLQDLMTLSNLDIKTRNASGVKYFFRVRLLKAISRLVKSPRNFLTLFRIHYEERVFHFDRSLVNIKSHSVIFGAFISKKYVNPVWYLLEPNLLKWLESIKFSNKVEDLTRKGCVVLHVRRGDTVKKVSSESRGIIGKQYYEDCLNEIGSESSSRYIVVVTDDLVTAMKDLSGLRIDYWFGPNDLNAVSALKLMTEARYFIGCNSTLSWWGAQILVNSKNGYAFLPKPWYAGAVEEIEESMFIEGAKYIEWKC